MWSLTGQSLIHLIYGYLTNIPASCSYILGLLLGLIGSDDGMAMYRWLGSVSCASDVLENELSFSLGQTTD